MLVTKSVVLGLLSLMCSVSATKVTGKPILTKRQAVVTVTNNGCTAICWDLSSLSQGSGTDCEVHCSGGFSTSMPATSTSTSTSISTSIVISTVTSTTKAALNQRTVVSTTSGDCSAVCLVNEEEGDIDCGFECGGDSVTSIPATSISTPTVTPTTEAALEKRTVATVTNGDCTAICWDLMPGTECDVQCSSDFKTKMPVPSRTPRIGNLEARENVQAHQVRDARLARKFGGLVGRDDTMTVTVTSIPENCTAGPESSILTTVAGMPTILPMQVPQEAGASDISAALSQASAALSLVQQAQGATATAIPSAASSALSEASAFLSSVAATAPISANATVATPASTGSAPTVTATTTVTSTSSTATASVTTTVTSNSSTATASVTMTATSTSSETITPSTTTTGSLVVSESGTTTSTSFPVIGAAPEYTVSTGLVLSLLVGLAANVAFLI